MKGGFWMRYMVSVTDPFYARLKDEAEKSGMNVSEYTRYCIKRYWDYMYCRESVGE